MDPTQPPGLATGHARTKLDLLYHDVLGEVAGPHRPTHALLYRINVAEAKLGVSRSTICRLVHDGELELVKIGKRSSGITAASLHDMIERNKASG